MLFNKYSMKQALFGNIKADSIRRGAQRSSKWLEKKIKNANWKKVTKPKPGVMYLSVYDAKYKDVLPVWDSHPLNIYWHADSKTILGLNLHYLTPPIRRKLLSLLEKVSRSDKDFKVAISALRTVTKMKAFQPAIHKYLFTNFKTQLVEIPMSEWDNVIFLPTAKWNRNKK